MRASPASLFSLVVTLAHSGPSSASGTFPSVVQHIPQANTTESHASGTERLSRGYGRTVGSKTDSLIVAAKGQVPNVDGGEQTIVPYVLTTLNNPDPAFKMASRANSPGADESQIRQHQRIFRQSRFDEVAANSPRGPDLSSHAASRLVSWWPLAHSSIFTQGELHYMPNLRPQSVVATLLSSFTHHRRRPPRGSPTNRRRRSPRCRQWTTKQSNRLACLARGEV